jgi:hypothetical protein
VPSDFAIMPRYFSGDAMAYPTGCGAQDLNQDGDVDAAYFAILLLCMRGPWQTPGC